MAIIHLYRETPEKGYVNTEMDCQEEFLEKFQRRGWKVKTSGKPDSTEKKSEDSVDSTEKKSEKKGKNPNKE